MLRIFTIILLSTAFIYFAHSSFSERNKEPKPEKVAVEPRMSAKKAPDKKETMLLVKKELAKISPSFGLPSKKEKIMKAKDDIEKIKAEWTVPSKPKNRKSSIDKSISELARRSEIQGKPVLKSQLKPEIKAEIYDDSQYSYLAEPQLKPLNALTKPVSFLDPVGGKISFKPTPPVYYSVFSEDTLKTEPVTNLESKKLFAAPASQAFLDRKNRIKKVVSQTRNYKKRAFINNIGLAAADVNQKILNERAALLYVYKRYENGIALTSQEKIWVEKLAEKYRVAGFSISSKAKRMELLSKVNVVPESLAVAQAALESGWGKSNLSRTGFNYFGQKCFEPKCGVKPAFSPRSRTQYAVFSSPREAVEEYIHNLNTNSSYKKFRIAREYLGSEAGGKQLVHYLDGYSEQGNSYESKVKQLIDGNNLE